MRFIVRPTSTNPLAATEGIPVELFAQPGHTQALTAGASVLSGVRRSRLEPTTAAWDFLTIALAAMVADAATSRRDSPDGWTREIQLDLALAEPDRWAACLPLLTRALRFLTTDIWDLTVSAQAATPFTPPRAPTTPDADCVALLSGGLDSLLGGIDLVASGRRPFLVSQTVRGDADKQIDFASRLGSDLRRIQLNHNVNTSPLHRPDETTQRARSLIFIAYAALIASTLDPDGADPIGVYLNENGFIAINPPLTPMRVGSLSTRTAHPRFLGYIQQVFATVGLNTRIINPYRLQTKGQMMADCSDQDALVQLAHVSTSCGRYQRYNYHHCGRCLPCQVRRAAFLRWGESDATNYFFDDLGIDDEDHSGFDDVRAVAMARFAIADDGLRYWAGSALSGVPSSERDAVEAMLHQGMAELGALQDHYQVN